MDQVNLDSLDSSFTPFQNEEASLDVLLRVANQRVKLTLDIGPYKFSHLTLILKNTSTRILQVEKIL